MDKMSKNISVLSIVIAIVILIRFIFNSNENIVYIIAGINIVAIAFVVYTIIEKILQNIIERIKKSGIPLQIAKRETKHIKLKIECGSIIISVILITVYFWLWCSEIGNDILSIITLGISILDDEIVKKVTEIYKI